MAGLLDLLNGFGSAGGQSPNGLLGQNWMTPELQQFQQQRALQGLSQGLLQASAPSPYKKSFFQVLGEGVQGLNQGQDKAATDVLALRKTQAEIAKDEGQAKLYSEGGGGGTTLKAAQAIMQQNPNLSFIDAYSIAKSGLGPGITYNNGQVAPLPGAPGAVREIAGAKKTGEKEAEFITQSKEDLPRTIDQAETAINQINQTLKAPGLDLNFGMTGLIPNLPGGQASDAAAMLDQIKGGAFLTAYGQLRGGGAITEIEGQKATDAYARMQKAQSAQAFRSAAKEYIGIIQKGVQRAKNAASGQVFNGRPTSPEAPAAPSAPDGNAISYEDYFK